jgi:hypothetical protein
LGQVGKELSGMADKAAAGAKESEVAKVYEIVEEDDEFEEFEDVRTANPTPLESFFGDGRLGRGR